MRYSKLLLLPVLFFGTVAIAADSTAPTTEMDKLSYSLGVKTGENFASQEIQVNTQQFANGLSDALNNKKPLMTDQQMQDAIMQFQEKQIAKITARDKKVAAENLVKSNKFFADNKKKSNVKTLSSGLQYTEITAGNGTSPKIGDTVTVNYRGTLLNGTEFDSSYSRKEPTTFPLENLIPGWLEALQMMKPGAKWKLYIPPQLAYGDKGAGRVIEPNSALIFEVELVSVQPKA